MITRKDINFVPKQIPTFVFTPKGKGKTLKMVSKHKGFKLRAKDSIRKRTKKRLIKAYV